MPVIRPAVARVMMLATQQSLKVLSKLAILEESSFGEDYSWFFYGLFIINLEFLVISFSGLYFSFSPFPSLFDTFQFAITSGALLKSDSLIHSSEYLSIPSGYSHMAL